MPSFFSAIGRTFGRKKGEDAKDKPVNQNLAPPKPKSKRLSVTSSLLDGHKTGTQSSAAAPSSPVAQQSSRSVRNVAPPTLTLTLPDIGTSDANDPGLDAVFDSGPANIPLLSESEVSSLVLTMSDALLLEEACAKIIIERGLEALGIMHPNWYSTSPSAQRKIISYFMHGITSPRPNGQVPTTTELAFAPFQSEIQYSRTPHDVASVLRWGLRHLTLNGKPFGNSSDEWGWYQTFSQSERSSSFPKRAYTDILTSLIPSNHANLLRCFLDLATSLAAHSEANGISGSKLSKTLGWWLLSNRSQGSDWVTFYSEWETAGRVLEHILLAHIRDQTAQGKMPRRLTELVQAYPYGKESDGIFLPKPRFTTRTHDALLTRIDIERLQGFEPSKRSILQLVEDALRAANLSSSDGYAGLWETLQKQASSVEESGGDEENTNGHGNGVEGKADISKIFADDTITLLNSTASGNSDGTKSPTLTMFTPPPSHKLSPIRRRSLSVGDAQPSSPTSANGLSRVSTIQPPADGTQKPPPSSTSNIGSDWGTFSSSGFFFDDKIGTSLAATLINTDAENPRPRPTARKSSTKKGNDTPRNRSVSTGPPPVSKTSLRSAETLRVKSCSVTSVDEAFIDFWSDAVLDPITAHWPQFVLCQLKPSAALTHEDKTFGWVVIEAVHSVRPATPKPEPETPVPSTPQTVDRRLSASSRKSPSVVSATTNKRRFPFFGSPSMSSKTISGSKKDVGRSPRIGEMGEILREEDSKASPKVTPVPDATHETSTTAVAAATATVTAAIGLGVTAAAVAVTNGHSEDKEKPHETSPPVAAEVPAPEPIENIVSEAAAPQKAEHTAAAAIDADIPSSAPAATAEESTPALAPKSAVIHDVPTAEYVPPIEDVVTFSSKTVPEEDLREAAAPSVVVDAPPAEVVSTEQAKAVPDIPEEVAQPIELTTSGKPEVVMAPPEMEEPASPIVRLAQPVGEPEITLPAATEVPQEIDASKDEAAPAPGTPDESHPLAEPATEPVIANSAEPGLTSESAPVLENVPAGVVVPEPTAVGEAITSAHASAPAEVPALENALAGLPVLEAPAVAEASITSSPADEPTPVSVLEDVPSELHVPDSESARAAETLAAAHPFEQKETTPPLGSVPADSDVPEASDVPETSVDPPSTSQVRSAPALENVPAGADLPVVAEVANPADTHESVLEPESAPVLENVPAGVTIPAPSSLTDGAIAPVISGSPKADEVAASYAALVEPVVPASLGAQANEVSLEGQSSASDAVPALLDDDVHDTAEPSVTTAVDDKAPATIESTPTPAVTEDHSEAEPINELSAPLPPSAADSRATSTHEAEATPEIAAESLDKATHSNGNGALTADEPAQHSQEST